MKILLRILVFIVLALNSKAQSGRVQVAFLGVFHMGETPDYVKGGIDDLLSDERQKQLQEVIDSLARFKPDKIFVENTPDVQPYWNAIYKNYLNGIHPVERSAELNEIFQIGIKLAKKINNPVGVTCINYIHPDLALGMPLARNKTDTLQIFYANELELQRPSYDNYFKQNPSVNHSFNDYLSNYEIWKKLTFKQHLLKLNSKKSLSSLHYFNITGWMDTNTNGYGAEFTAKEYFRNAKIMQNILLNVSPYDRKLLIIIGGGHVQILSDMMKTHPYFEIIDISEILK